MSAVQDGVAPSSTDVELFERLEQYPWQSDDEFQSGLQAILGPEPDPSQAEALMLRAQCFYFARKFGTSVDFAAYQQWHSQRPMPSEPQSSSQQASAPSQEEAAAAPAVSAGQQEQKPPYPVSFSHVVELITTGQPIPGIKDIPDTVLEGQASQSSAQARKKPWEP